LIGDAGNQKVRWDVAEDAGLSERRFAEKEQEQLAAIEETERSDVAAEKTPYGDEMPRPDGVIMPYRVSP